MNRGARHAPAFRDAADCQCFLDRITEAVARFGIEVHVFCLMPNHFHLLVRSVFWAPSAVMRHLMGGSVLSEEMRGDRS